jgi:hypothetical protein
MLVALRFARHAGGIRQLFLLVIDGFDYFTDSDFGAKGHVDHLFGIEDCLREIARWRRCFGWFLWFTSIR